jgi:hypothetical protein
VAKKAQGRKIAGYFTADVLGRLLRLLTACYQLEAVAMRSWHQMESRGLAYLTDLDGRPFTGKGGRMSFAEDLG